MLQPSPSPFFSRPSRPVKVAVLVDLPRSDLSGGHVKGWESRAAAVAASSMQVDLTIFFSGPPKAEVLAPHVQLRQLKPVFSTKRLSFLPYVPDHTDLAPYHPELAKELRNFDVIHTTDAYFAYARTAERVSKRFGIPLVTSFHTDTPSYARIFTGNAITKLCGGFSALSRFLIDTCRLPQAQEQKMLRRMRRHLACCAEALVIRPEDAAAVREVIGNEHLRYLRPVADKNLFNPDKADRSGIEAEFGIPPGRFIALFAGRIDVGKNAYTLIEAVERLIAKGLPIHLIAAGVGPAAQDMRDRLKGHVTLPGFVGKQALARLMASSDVFAFPSEVEIRSLVALEALSSGLPVLVSQRSGIAELVKAGEALRGVAGGGESWFAVLRDLIRTKDHLAPLRILARSYAEHNVLSWEESMRDDFLTAWQGVALSGRT